MRHPVLLTMYNRTPSQLELSKLALQSVLNQDLEGMELTIINNGSTDSTREWLSNLQEDGEDFTVRTYEKNQHILKLMNDQLKDVFRTSDHVLLVPNDVILSPNAYREMLKWPRGFVSATPIEQDEPFQPLAGEVKAISENTPFCVILIRRWAYRAIVEHSGCFFDESFEHYGSDCDIALRISACGIRGVQLDIPVWHYRSASWRLAPSGEGEKMTYRADVDRAHFRRRYGFQAGSTEYAAAARDINFRAGYGE